jgi:hypothetical protein
VNEHVSTPGIDDPPPRASLILPPGEAGNAAGIWMGGARALHGEEIPAEHLTRAWLIDLAGDMPAGHHAAAAQATFCVFSDVEEVPSSLWRIEQTARDAALAARGGHDAPEHVYIVCSQGLNRSGLVTGLLLTALGLSPEDAIARIRRVRPGSLANHAFERLLLASAPLR